MPKAKIKQSRLELTRASLQEAPSTTRVKAWTFQVDKKNYVIISYFMPRDANYISVFPSNKKGVKTSSESIVNIRNCTDYLRGFNEALEILLPEEIKSEREVSELSATVA